MKDYYKILEVTPDASQDVIKAAYKALVKKLHPDNGGDAEYYRVNIADINEAYDVLSDAEKKAAYDESYKKGGFSESSYTQNTEKTWHDNNMEPEGTVKKDSEYHDAVENIEFMAATFILWQVFRFFKLPNWAAVIAEILFVFYLSAVITFFAVRWINSRVPGKAKWGDDDKTALSGVIWLSGIRIIFNANSIDNWLAKVCMFLLVVCIAWFVIKVVQTVARVMKDA